MTLHKKEYIFEEKVFKDIKYVIKSPDIFNNLTEKEKRNVSDRLKNLAMIWNYTDFFKIPVEFDPYLKEFIKIIKEEIDKPIKRANSADFNNKLKNTYIFLDNLIRNELFFNENIRNYEDVIKELNLDKLFYILVSSSISCLNMNNEETSNEEIILSKFVKVVRKNLIIYFAYDLIEKNSDILVEINDYSEKIVNLSDFIDLTYQIVEVFIKIFDFESKKNIYISETGHCKENIIITLPKMFLNNVVIPLNLPEIVEPTTNYNTLYDRITFTKKVKNGYSSVIFSKKTKKALVYSQKKKFKINEETLKIFKNIDEMPYEIVKNLDTLPFTPLKIIEKLINDVNEIKKNIDKEKTDKIAEFFGKIRKNKDKKFYKSIEISEITGLSIEEVELNKSLFEKKKELNKIIKLRKFHNTIVRLAEIFVGFPIYYINYLDFRLRMYPWSYLFSRTSGIYKYLLCEYEKTEVNEEGIKCLEKSYGMDINLSDEEIIINENNSSIYKILLKREVMKVRKYKNAKSDILIEIDQKSSSAVIASIILGDEKLASKCNIFGKSKIGAPESLIEEFRNFFEDKLSDSFIKLINNRDIHKKLFMCFIYNQNFGGRINNINEYINNAEIANKYREEINTLAKYYPCLIDIVFSNIGRKKNLLNKIVKFYIKKSLSPVVIDTLDGSRIKWTIYSKKKQSSKKKYKSIIEEKYKSYSIDENVIDKIDSNKIINGFLASFLHSIDAAIMRLIIVKMKEKSGYVINHLHDSIQFSPNQYENIIKNVEEVYKENNIEEGLENLLLTNLKNNIIKEYHEEFEDLVKELKSNDFKKINMKNINIKSMFPFK